MKKLIASLICTLAATCAFATSTAQDVKSMDPAMEKQFLEILPKLGTLTSTNQGGQTYTIAVVCEYPQKGEPVAFQPYCKFKKVSAAALSND